MSPSDELDHLLLDNNKLILQNIADDLRSRLPLEAMFPSEAAAHHKVRGVWMGVGVKEAWAVVVQVLFLSCRSRLIFSSSRSEDFYFLSNKVQLKVFGLL